MVLEKGDSPKTPGCSDLGVVRIMLQNRNAPVGCQCAKVLLGRDKNYASQSGGGKKVAKHLAI